MMEEKYVERWKNLIRVLKNVKDEELQMETFFDRCGTEACAAGWAARDPWFQQQGFYVVPSVSTKDGRPWDVGYNCYRGLAACEVFFDENYIDNVFIIGGYPREATITPQMVIAKIEEILLKEGVII